jgi:hypothetical protein
MLALAAISPASAPERSAKLIPSRVHGSSSPAASPATMTLPDLSGAPAERHRVRCPESRITRLVARPSRSVNSRK